MYEAGLRTMRSTEGEDPISSRGGEVVIASSRTMETIPFSVGAAQTTSTEDSEKMISMAALEEICVREEMSKVVRSTPRLLRRGLDSRRFGDRIPMDRAYELFSRALIATIAAG
jgi:hypothetical protein